MSRYLAAVFAVAMLTACADQDPIGPRDGQSSSLNTGAEVNVMTRNLYLGANLDPIFAAPPQQIPLVAAGVWGAIQATDFPRRAGALAKEIADNNPDLVGLQEAVQYYVQSPGDAAIGGSTPATAIRYDFVQLLLDSLASRGVHYSVVAMNTNAIVELPVYTGRGALPFDDVRFVDHDVILARGGVSVTNAQQGNFSAKVSVPVAGSVIHQTRGWTSVDAMINGVAFRFANTHFEVQSFAPVQGAQAAELLAVLNASLLPVVLVGDMNSAADGSQTATYSTMIGAGFVDGWNQSSAGYTCCHLPDLSNAMPALDQRIDLVLTRGFTSVNAQVKIVGDKSVDAAYAGIWPSDHAGLVARLVLNKH